MKGHDQLIAMRRAGQTPRSVYLTDSDDTYARKTAGAWHQHPHCHDGGYIAHIRIEADDMPEALDLRCIKGLECHVASDRGDERFLRLFQSVADAGASAVAGLSAGEVHVFKATTEVS